MKDVKIYEPCRIANTVKIGEGSKIGAFCDIGDSVLIGKNCSIQTSVTISNGCRIGDNVFIGPNTSLLNDKYPMSNILEPVIVHRDVVIGGGCVILPGVILNHGCKIGAGSVVTKSVGAGKIVYGNPAKVKK
jgi:acetyltransferase-like isoleucine patch superfamily enzyme